MSTPDTNLLAAADDMSGRHLAVWHSAGIIHIEIGEAPERVDVDLSIEAARVILNGMADAALDARLYELEHAVAELEELREYRRP
jgi:hypothetical protein